MEKRVNSRSDVQQEIEKHVLKRVEEELGNVAIESNPKLIIDSEKGTYICPDFYSEGENLIGEIYSHVGKLKGSQPDKIATDILKMMLYEKVCGTKLRKIIAVCEEDALKQLSGKSFLAEAIRKFDVEILYIKLSSDDRDRLKNIMYMQNLLNN